jgi:hypothetical protein
LLWVTLVTVIKLSILHFYTRVFRVSAFLRASYAAMGLCAAFWTAAFFATAFFCTPPRKSWYSEVPGRCGDSHKFYTGCASTDLVIDVIVIMLPMPVLWNLQMALAKKVALTAIFALGFLIIFITAIRLKFMNELDNNDATYSYAKMAVFSSIVPLLGIINACLPIMRPAFRTIFGTPALESVGPKSYGTGHSSQSQSWIRKRTTITRTDGSQFERLEEPEFPLVEVTCSGTKSNSAV